MSLEIKNIKIMVEECNKSLEFMSIAHNETQECLGKKCDILDDLVVKCNDRLECHGSQMLHLTESIIKNENTIDDLLESCYKINHKLVCHGSQLENLSESLKRIEIFIKRLSGES